MKAVWFLPRKQDLSRGTSQHGQAGPDRDGVAQAHGTLGCCHTDALVALATEELSALVGVVAQSTKDGTGGRQEAVLACGCGKLAEAGAKDEASLHVTRHEAMVLEGNGEAMRGRTGQSGGADELGQGRWPGFECSQNGRSLVKNADSARVVHNLILPSQSLRRKFIPRDSAQTSHVSHLTESSGRSRITGI